MSYTKEIRDELTIEITLDMADCSQSGGDFDLGISCHDDEWDDNTSMSSLTLYLDHECDCEVCLLEEDDELSCTSIDEIAVDSYDEEGWLTEITFYMDDLSFSAEVEKQLLQMPLSRKAPASKPHLPSITSSESKNVCARLFNRLSKRPSQRSDALHRPDCKTLNLLRKTLISSCANVVNRR
jgi:hypothetical protein